MPVPQPQPSVERQAAPATVLVWAPDAERAATLAACVDGPDRQLLALRPRLRPAQGPPRARAALRQVRHGRAVRRLRRPAAPTAGPHRGAVRRGGGAPMTWVSGQTLRAVDVRRQLPTAAGEQLGA